jgi:LEA14-like dessication related protein
MDKPKRRRGKWIILLLILAGLAIGAFVVFIQYSEPEVKVTFNHGYRTEPQPHLASIKIYNPNRLGMTLDSTTYMVSLRGKQVLTGHSSGKTPIPAMDTTAIQVPFSFSINELIAADSVSEGDLEIKGEIFLHLWNGHKLSLPIDSRERVPQMRPLTLKIESIIAEKATLSIVKAQVSASIYNPNNIALAGYNGEYELRVDTAVVARGIVPYPLQIGPDSKKMFTVTLTADAARALKVMTDHPESPYTFMLEMQAVSPQLPAYTGRYSCTASGLAKELIRSARQ